MPTCQGVNWTFFPSRRKTKSLTTLPAGSLFFVAVRSLAPLPLGEWGTDWVSNLNLVISTFICISHHQRRLVNALVGTFFPNFSTRIILYDTLRYPSIPPKNYDLEIWHFESERYRKARFSSLATDFFSQSNNSTDSHFFSLQLPSVMNSCAIP